MSGEGGGKQPQGRGRGESAKIARMDLASSSAEYKGAARAPGQVPVLEIERSGSSGSGSSSPSSGEKTIRGRGGFKAVELHTIPSNVTDVRAKGGGQQIEVLANFVRIAPLPTRSIYQYRIDFQPNVESVTLRGRLFFKIKETHFNKLAIYDNMSDARSSVKLPDKTTQVELENPNEPGQKVMVTIKNVGVVTGSFEMVRVYNMHSKHFLKALGFFQVSTTGAYVHPDFRTPVGRDTGIVAMRGYRTSANVHEENTILMNFESVHKLSQLKNVLENMLQMRGQQNFRQAIKTSLTGKLVVTNYNKIVYRIEDVDFSMNPQSTFEDKKTKQQISYIKYYQDRYNLRIQDTQQPLLLVVPNNNRRKDQESTEDRTSIFLVPELCNITGLTDQQRADGRLRIDLVKSSQIEPQTRVQHLREFLKRLHSNQEVGSVLDRWGYSYDQDLISIKARIMPTESVGLGRSLKSGREAWPKVDPKTANFDNLIMREVLAVAPPCAKLKIIIGRNDLNNLEPILKGVRTGFEKVGLTPSHVEVIKIQDGDYANLYVQHIKKLSPDASAAIIVIPSQNKEKYDAIKKCASVEKGLITQVITSRLILDPRKAGGASVKIGIQMAAKLGGEPWHVNIPLSGAMVCGYDTYHDTAKRGRSFGAFVASMNNEFSRWWSKADHHDHLDELSAHMAANLSLSLQKYRENNKEKYPDRLFIYRDGVSDGQLDHVVNVELKEIRKVVEGISEKIRLAFIVVNKRIGARFYWKNGASFINCAPGTVIDDVVTRKERYDFYLISQSTRNGTVAPTYYNIIHDDTGLDAAKHQAMAYKMCFAYYNWSGTVRVPAPCQYAHKLALLCGEHLHGVPSTTLDDRLHFL